MKNSYVYIMTNSRNRVLYIGVTSDLYKRVWEHKNHFYKGFSDTYKTDKLVWYVNLEKISEAITLEKQMKKWKREWKENKINALNPEWRDLIDTLKE